MIWHKDCMAQRTVKQIITRTPWILSVVVTLYSWIYQSTGLGPGADEIVRLQRKSSCYSSGAPVSLHWGARVSLTSFASSRWCASRDGWRTQTHREFVEILQNETDQRDTSNRFICTERPDVKSYTLYYHDVLFLNSILCLVSYTFFTTLQESKFDVKTWMSHFRASFYHINMWHGAFGLDPTRTCWKKTWRGDHDSH